LIVEKITSISIEIDLENFQLLKSVHLNEKNQTKKSIEYLQIEAAEKQQTSCINSTFQVCFLMLNFRDLRI
jgi:hypothetical protein